MTQINSLINLVKDSQVTGVVTSSNSHGMVLVDMVIVNLPSVTERSTVALPIG